MSDTTRRAVLAGAAGITATTVLAACGSDTGSTGTTGGGGAAAGGNATTGASATTGGDAATGALAKKSDIPVGGGKVFGSQNVVITQPTAGQFKAFSATCTHQGCPVSTVTDGAINCPCHGSKFSAADGSVKNGPAAKPLAAKTIKINGEDITLA
jgi:Rieske Fe-S protein